MLEIWALMKKSDSKRSSPTHNARRGTAYKKCGLQIYFCSRRSKCRPQNYLYSHIIDEEALKYLKHKYMLHKNYATVEHGPHLQEFKSSKSVQMTKTEVLPEVRTTQELCGRRSRITIAKQIVRLQNSIPCRFKKCAYRTWNCAAAEPPEGHFCQQF
nr:uncharacterized protein LOC104110420 [Nicotiana tomentosiformis]